MKKTHLTFFVVAILVLVVNPGAIPAPEAAAQDISFDPMYDADVAYNPTVPTPESFLGRELGAAPVRHHELVEYITMVAEASPRMTVEVIGYSHERRPILFVVATSPGNHARLEELKAQHVALSEPGSGGAVSPDMPVVTWLNYGVHGAESSGMDASLPTIYHLAAAEDEETRELLENSIILVTAIFNPDGHAKRAHWFDTWGGERTITDPQHIEHDYDWMQARTNHYGFDLNRQWLLLTQPEPRAWMKKWHDWRPNLTVDYHEMGSQNTYYFHPGIETRTNPLVPEEAERLMAEVVQFSEGFLDTEAKLYYHGENFDNFYIGKGSTFPLINGGVGVLYEAGAALGRAIETPNGIRTYHENIRKHFRTSLASAKGALELRSRLLEYQKRFYDGAVREGARDNVKAYVFASPGDPARSRIFLDLLQYHRIRAYGLARDVEAGGKRFAAGAAYVVPMSQPQYRLIKGIFDSVSEFEDPTFYDVSAWTLPLAFDLDYAPLAGRAYRADMLGGEADTAVIAAEAPDEASYAYVFRWNGYYAPRALGRLLEKKLLAKVATKPFEATTTRGRLSFERGTILVPLVNQPEDADVIYGLLAQASAEDGIFVHAITSGRGNSGAGGVDLGGPAFSPLTAPKALLVTKPGGSSLYEAGEIWHLLDYRMQMPLTLAPAEDLPGLDLTKYTHVILPGGNYGKVDKKLAAKLREWVAAGGTLIAQRQGAKWARDNVLDYKPKDKNDQDGKGAEQSGAAGEDEKPADEKEARIDYAEMESRNAVEVIGGTIFGGDLDITHPLGFGYADRSIALHRNWTEVFEVRDNPYATVIRYAAQPVLSGYASDKNRDKLAGTAALIAERKGHGSVILFADDPNFRGIWYGGNKLFLNGLFFSKAFSAPRKENGEE